MSHSDRYTLLSAEAGTLSLALRLDYAEPEIEAWLYSPVWECVVSDPTFDPSQNDLLKKWLGQIVYVSDADGCILWLSDDAEGSLKISGREIRWETKPPSEPEWRSRLERLYRELASTRVTSARTQSIVARLAGYCTDRLPQEIRNLETRLSFYAQTSPAPVDQSEAEKRGFERGKRDALLHVLTALDNIRSGEA